MFNAETSLDDIDSIRRQKIDSPNIPAAGKLTVRELLNTLNLLSQISNRYLGSTITARYWESSRPNISWLNQFTVERSAQFSYSGKATEPVNSLQLQYLQQWIKAFVKSCSQIIQDFPSLIDRQKLAFALEI